jgi:DNA polymerase-1
MAERYAILDMMNLAYRSWYALNFTYKGAAPRLDFVFSSLIRTCKKLENDLCADTMVFCFDGGYDFRKSVYPEYKQNRKTEELREELKLNRQLFHSEIELLRTLHLPAMGAANVFWAKGFEADDLIASCVRNLDVAKKVYIVSTDEDLYQLIEGTRVVVYKPSTQTVFSEEDFRMAFSDLPPCLYASAKAWAGCSSDGIPGLPRVGMKTACKFVNGHNRGREDWWEHLDIYNRNIQLVKLPAPGTPKCVPVPQENPIAWDELLKNIERSSTPRGMKK